MRIAFSTFGCKINQYETDQIRRDLKDRGCVIVSFESEADAYIINTCSVTKKSDYQCRQAIRSAAGRGKGAKVIVTGCYAATQPAEIQKITGVDIICGNPDKPSIAELVTKTLATNPENPQKFAHEIAPEALPERSRGFLKIQDGCDNRCSYCIVPLARGRSRSVPQSAVIRDFDQLVSEGCAEIVLSGIHIGTYGKDLDSMINLTELLKELAARRKGSRIRLSSIEPREITDDMINLLGNGLCRHLHIPLQSGDDTILTSMKRDYSSAFYLKLVKKIADQVSGIALGADVMVGYPGEGEVEFQNTLHFLENAPLTHLHIFNYSRRPGTLAAEMGDQVADRIKKKRSEQLRELGKDKNLAFRKKQSGIPLKAVVEANMDAATGTALGLTDNYIRTHIKGVKPEHLRKELGICINEVNLGGDLAALL